jgi:hypothetical protein
MGILLANRTAFFLQRDPEAKRTVADGQLGLVRQARLAPVRRFALSRVGR